MTQFSFGGDWTEQKLAILRKYLPAYATIMKKHAAKFRYAYIDAFAGTGYRLLKQDENPEQLVFPEFGDSPQASLDGSARIALKVDPPFDRYIFIEKDETRYKELLKLKLEFENLKDRIQIENADANAYLGNLLNRNWTQHRAVLFLDPFGMQVPWTTVEAIARTQAIDMWYLFPIGIGVNRLLKKDGQIHEKWVERLDLTFGERGWFDAFYQITVEKGLFGEEKQTLKISDFESIGRYFVHRLETIFPGVAQNPRLLYNSRNNPMFLFCFAAANKQGAKTAVKIVEDILARP